MQRGTLALKKNRKANNWDETIDGMLMLKTTDMLPSAEEVKCYKGICRDRTWLADS